VISELLDEIAASTHDVEVIVDERRDVVTVHAHRELLHQALDNLTANARKHAAGRVVLSAHDLDGGFVRLDVSDDGHGMSRQDAERAVERFYRAPGSNGDGFGLGLPIVREVVRAMEGTLSIDSTPGQGTTVSIVLASAGAERPSP
jgi:signal transduction histidine kinase